MSEQNQLNQTPLSAHPHYPPSPPNVSTPQNVYHLSYRNTTSPANLLLAPTTEALDLRNQNDTSSFRLLPGSIVPSADPSLDPTQSQSPPSSNDVNMELTTSSSVCSSDASSQRELPTALPTPAKALGRLALRSLNQTDTQTVRGEIDKQNANLRDLSKQLGHSRSHLEAKLKTFADKTEEQFQNLHTIVTETKNKLENEMENMLKGMKTLVVTEIKNQDIAQLQEVRFMVEQLQHEIQQDIHSHHQTGIVNQTALSSKMDHCKRSCGKFTGTCLTTNQ